MSSPASELERRRSASERRIHGAATSTKVYATTHRQRGSSGRMSPRVIASGTRIVAATVVRARTNVAGASSPTATLIRRYGMPQITAIAAKRSQPRRLIHRSLSLMVG